MKLKKKPAMLISLAIGTVMFATTAMAEIASKSGYEQLKDAMKYTGDSCTSSSKLSNYTMEMSFFIKDNGNIVASEESTRKYDLSKYARENISKTFDGKNTTDGYYYSDKSCNIVRNSEQDVYYVNESPNYANNKFITNPFKEKEAGDIEKIADALVGNLKDSVVVKENSDGSKELSASLTETQIPSIVNAVTSFQFKRQSGSYNRTDNKNTMPKITNDIFVKDIKGNMTLDKDGLIQSALGTGILSGKDEDGTEHNLSLEVLFKITNINSTIVNKIDLTGKKVEKSVQNSENDRSKLNNPDKFIGSYKNDIIIEEDGKFQKIGERNLTIAHIDDKNIAGNYKEEYFKGYEDYSTNKKSFNFDAKFNDKDNFDANFDYTNSNGKINNGDIYINSYSAKIYFNLHEQSGKVLEGSEFSRVFD